MIHTNFCLLIQEILNRKFAEDISEKKIIFEKLIYKILFTFLFNDSGNFEEIPERRKFIRKENSSIGHPRQGQNWEKIHRLYFFFRDCGLSTY